ncbi:RES family NAD+ phosphorylase [Streptomyces odontomachi]|uniref:RES family NAD+ phosphorylase n=1 Tax=Streptomyces odontomachi TaxID=2944940 RepID=UPI002109EABC|nr:RES family NAD+ phosphorylase [Streptomyces sp. ODS25]
MPHYQPPDRLTGTPGKAVLPRGTLLHRVHRSHRPADAFNPRPAHCLYGGGRFDGTSCAPYPYLYAGLGVAAALCETLVRDLEFEPSGGPRLLTRAAVEGRRLTALRLTTDLTVLPLLDGRDLAAVHQDPWLIHTEARDYAYTRDWGHWIRRHTEPWAMGFLWPSKREPGERALVLFGDRCPPGALRVEPDSALDLDGPAGREWLDAALEPYHVRLAP